MALFCTRSAGNEGAKLSLVNPVNGKDTEHWVKILSMDSDVYMIANTRAMRSLPAIMELPEESKLAAMESNQLDLVAALVVDWSFPSECTHENVKAFLKEAPQIRRAIDNQAGNRALFMPGSSPSSETGQEPTSGSAAAPPEAAPRGVDT